VKQRKKRGGRKEGDTGVTFAGAPELPSTTSPKTRRGRGGLKKRKVKKVEKQQNKGGGADLTASREAPEAGEQRRQPDLAPLVRVPTAHRP
jgi:hypothetical protein